MREKVKRTLKIAMVALVTVFSGVWLVVSHVMDLIGRSTLQDDFLKLEENAVSIR